MNKIKLSKYVLKILETINEFNWVIKRVWAENNCIYAEVKKVTGVIEIEGLYAGSDDNKQDVNNVIEELKRAL